MSEQGEERLSDSQAWVLGFVLGALVLVLLAVAYTIGFNRGESEGEEGAATEAPAEKTVETTAEEVPAGPGLDLFVESCGSCHTLEAADTSGAIGPNLDDLSPDSAQVLAAIENGGTGSGAMPSALLAGEEAQQVADFVGGSAGR
jgi:mono/diheme cytochrome c family protein